MRDRAAVLRAFARSLGQESHNIRVWPELTWQQLFNRLQWEPGLEDCLLDRQLALRASSGRRPWARNRIPSQESGLLHRVLHGHGGAVNSCAWSPCSTRLVSASDDGILRIWDLRAGGDPIELRGHDAPVRSCGWSRDGSYVISASDDATLRIWDTAFGACREVLRGHEGPVKECSFSPDGRRILSTSADDTARIWDLDRLPESRTVPHSGLEAYAWAPDGTWFVVADRRGTRIWSTATGEQRLDLSGERRLAKACAVSPDGVRVLSTSVAAGERAARPEARSEVVEWKPNPELPDELNEALRQLAEMTKLREALEDDVAADVLDEVVGSKVETEFWISDAASGLELDAWSVPALQHHPVCAWSPDASRYLVGVGSTLGVVNPDSGEGAVTHGCDIPATTGAWSPDGMWVTSGHKNGAVLLWEPVLSNNVEPDTNFHVLEGHTEEVLACAWSPNGRWVASSSQDGTVRVWDAAAATPHTSAPPPTGHRQDVTDCAWSPDGTVLATAGSDGALRTWDAATGAALHTLEGEGPIRAPEIRACAWRPDSTRLVGAYEDGVLRTWDAIGGVPGSSMSCVDMDELLEMRAAADEAGERFRIDEVVALHDCAWSPDSALIASAGEDGTVQIWDAAARRHVCVLLQRFFDAGVDACAWRPDGGVLASAGRYDVAVWDPVTGALLHRIRGRPPFAWHPNSGELVSACIGEPTLAIWDFGNGDSSQRILEGHEGPVTSCAFTADGHRIASTSVDGTVRIWDTRTASPQHVLEGHTDSVDLCAWSPDGDYVVSAGVDRTLRIWDAADGETMLTALILGQPKALAWHPSAARIAAGDVGGNVYLFELEGFSGPQSLEDEE